MPNQSFINAMQLKEQKVPPIWFMRQAGRYHQHYQNFESYENSLMTDGLNSLNLSLFENIKSEYWTSYKYKWWYVDVIQTRSFKKLCLLKKKL